MEKGAKVREKIQETFSAIEVVKSFSGEKKETSKIKQRFRKLIETEIILSLFSSISNRMLEIISGLNLIIILWVSGYEIISGRLTIGQYVAFVGYLGYLYGPIQFYAMTFIGFQKTLIACKRISELLSHSTEDDNPNRAYRLNDFQGVIKFNDVSYNYGNGKMVLENISFTINPGDKVAFVGTSGVGKTTLINLILGFYLPSKGRITIDDVDLSTIKLEPLRKRIGIVSQNLFLFNDTVLNNIKYSKPEASLEQIISISKKSDAHNFISELEKGYFTNIGELGKKLSEGQKQRISIARAILRDPEIIIFDEPTTHLDSISIEKLVDSFRKLFVYKTCIFISHRLPQVSWVDKIYVLEKKKIVQKGSHEQLICEEGIYKKMYSIG